ncbi:hypothetical protein MRX96_055784 [Rhipicephalus microplus]
MVLTPPRTSMQDAAKLGKALATSSTGKFPGVISLEYEKIYRPYLLVNEKGYVGGYYTSSLEKCDKINIKGLEVVRRDSCSYAFMAMKALGLPPTSIVGDEGSLSYFFVGDEAFPLKEYVMRSYARRSVDPSLLSRNRARSFFVGSFKEGCHLSYRYVYIFIASMRSSADYSKLAMVAFA